MGTCCFKTDKANLYLKAKNKNYNVKEELNKALYYAKILKLM